jgi:PAS domain S-box-containing protein
MKQTVASGADPLPGRLEALRRTGLLDSPAEESFDRLTRLARQVLDVPVALVSLVDGDRQFLKSQSGLPEPWASRREMPLSHSFCRHVVERAEPLIVEDAREHPLLQDDRAIRELEMVAYAGFPLMDTDGHVLGSLCAADSRPRRWAGAEIEALHDLSALVMTEVALRRSMGAVAEQTRAVAAAEAETRARGRFVDLVQGLDAIVWEMDASTWMFTFVNRRAEEILGYPAERWIDEPGFWADVILHPDDRDWALGFCMSATNESRDHEFEYRAVAADGRTVHLRDLVRVIRNEDGSAALLRGVMIDITEQKETENELRERERQAALAASVGVAMAESSTLLEILQRCAEVVVEHLDAAFARVWILDEAEQVLELQASAGMYTHLDGPHGRVPVGAFKIGKIAKEERPHLTNDVLHDLRVSDKEWAEREGMVAFAGYPLLLEGRLLGVVAMFARHPLSEGALEALRTVAERLALVVERKRTESTLQVRERQLADAQQLALLGTWSWQVGADRVEWSDQLYRIFGVTPGEPISYEEYLGLIHPEDRDRVSGTVQRALETRGRYHLEHRVQRPDGTVRHVFSEGEVATDEQGRPVRVFGVAQDITERKEAAERAHQLALEVVAREEAEAAQQQVQRILESITDAFLALDHEWRFTYLNREAEHLLQRKRAELLGQVLWTEFPDAVGSTFERMYRRAMETQTTVEFVEFFPPLDTWFEVKAFPSVEGLSIYFRNISDRKRAEQALRENEERFRAVQETSPDGFMIFRSVRDDDGTIQDFEWLYVNPAAERSVGHSADYLLGKRLLEEMPGNREEGLFDDYVRVVETGERSQRIFHYQHEGLDHWFRNTSVKVGDGFAVAFADITAEKHAEMEIRHQSELTRTITDNATGALFMMDTRGFCTFMNPAAEEMIGFSLDEIRDMPLHDAIHHLHPDGTPYPMSECPIDRALPENNDVRAHEDVFIRKNGEFFPVTCAARPIIRDGVPVGTVVEVRDITEAKRAEQELRQSEERFRSLIEATAAIVWTTPATGEFGGDQPGWSRFTGQTEAEYTGWGWLDRIHSDDRAKTAAAWQKALEQRSTYEVEHRVRRHDGEYRYMLARGVPILEDDGEIREWVGQHADLTERKLLEERQRFLIEAGTLLSSSLHYETTLASVAQLAVPTLADWCAIDLLDDSGAIHRVEVAHPDPAMRQLALELEQRYPADPEATTGVPQVLRTGEPELVPEIPEELLQASAQDEEHRRIIRSLGLKSYMVVPLIARGRTLGAITLVSAESGRRYGRADLETAQELALRAAFAVDNARLVGEINLERSRLSSIFTEAPAYIATLRGPDHVFEMANPQYLQLVGSRDILGKPVREALPEVVEQGFIDLLDNVHRTREPFVGREVAMWLQGEGDRPATERFLNFVYQPILDGSGQVAGIFVHAVEVTDQVRARQELERKADELARLAGALERSNRELDQFAYVTSHDLKAPLRGIANLAQWIEEDLPGEAPDEVREHLDLLKGRVHRMEGLIDGILQYSRAGRVRGEVEQVDTGALLNDVIDLLDPPEGVEVEVPGEMPLLRTERLPLQQVFLNLVGNAAKYVGRDDGRIRVEVRKSNGMYEFSVSDNGPGIAPQYHDRIFGIFQTLEARDKVEGTGIGLSLVKKIVEYRGGRVWVESEEGAGATFRFTWPA